jgi:hypothetical protein
MSIQVPIKHSDVSSKKKKRVKTASQSLGKLTRNGLSRGLPPIKIKVSI